MPTFMFGSSPAGSASNASKPLGAFKDSTVPSVLGENKKSDAVGVFHSPTLGGTLGSGATFVGFGSPSLGGIGKSSSTPTVPASGFSFKADTEKAAMQAKASSSFTFAVSTSGTGSDSSVPGQSSQAGELTH